MALTDIAVAILDQNKLLSNMEDTNISTYVVVDDIGAHLKKAEERRQAQSGDELESQRDNKIRDSQLLKTLENINSSLKNGSLGGGSKPSSGSGMPSLPTMGLLGMGVSVAVGAFIGIIEGQLSAIKTLLPTKFIEDLGKDIGKSIRNMKVGLAMNIELIKTSVSEKITSLRTALSSGIDRISKVFSISDDSKLAKAFVAIKSGMASFAKPFITAGEAISSLVSGPASKTVDTIGSVFGKIKTFFTGIGSKLGAIGGMIGSVASTVGKIFAPIAIIMTLFDTVKGAIDGFMEGGLIGGIEGAVTGFFNSLIFGPLNMIKDAIAWIAGKFGFENTEAALKEFSFTEMFSSIVEKLFYPFKWIQDKVVGFAQAIPKFFENQVLDFVPDFAKDLFTSESTNVTPSEITTAPPNTIFSTIKENERALEEAILRRSGQPIIVSAPSQQTTNVSNSSTAVMGSGGMSMTDSFDVGTRNW